jgi:hypothetical protein
LVLLSDRKSLDLREAMERRLLIEAVNAFKAWAEIFILASPPVI